MPLLTTLTFQDIVQDTFQAIAQETCCVALWKITEDEPTLALSLTLSADEQADLNRIHYPAHRVEWLASRVALQSLAAQLGYGYQGLYKDEFGKPHLIGRAGDPSVSLSHTEGWAAAAWHPTRPVGLDIEPLRDKFSRVVPRVLSASEIAHAGGHTGRLAVYWCAKEALYKLYGKRNLTFRQHLLIDPFADGDTQLTGHVRLPDMDQTLAVHCHPLGPGLLAVAF
jgi:4'-phosphopantetheinyl transferase